MFATPRRMLQLAPKQYIDNRISKHIYKYTYIYVYTDTHRYGKHQTTKNTRSNESSNWHMNHEMHKLNLHSKLIFFLRFVLWSSLDVRGSKFQWTFLSKVHKFTMPKWMASQVRRKLFSQWPQAWPHSQILSFMFLNPHVRNLNTMWEVKRRIGAGSGGEGAKILPWWTMDTAGEIASLHHKQFNTEDPRQQTRNQLQQQTDDKHR